MPKKLKMPDAVVWKDEGPGGPVWIRRDGQMFNYEDSEHTVGGKPVAKWFTRAQAIAIANHTGLPFEEG